MRPLYLLAVLVWISSSGYMAARFVTLVFAAQLGHSASMVGALAANFAIVSAFLSVPTGRLIDRVGSKRPLLWSCSVLALIVALGALWRELAVLFTIAIIAGIAHNTMVLAFQRLAGELGPPAERPAAFGLLGLGFSLSNLTAPVAAGFAIDHAGFTASYVLFALVPLVSFVFVWTDQLPWPPVHPARRRGASQAELDALPPRSGTLGLLRITPLTRLYVACALFEAAWMGFGFMLPIHGTQLNMKASDIGLIAGSAGLMLLATRSCMTWLLRHITPWQMLIAGGLLIALGFVGIALTTNFPLMCASGAIIGLGQGVAGPMLNALIYDAAPAHEAGESMGLRTLINNISQGLMPLAAGPLATLFGLTPVFWVLAVSLTAFAWSSRGYWRTRQRFRP